MVYVSLIKTLLQLLVSLFPLVYSHQYYINIIVIEQTTTKYLTTMHQMSCTTQATYSQIPPSTTQVNYSQTSTIAIQSVDGNGSTVIGKLSTTTTIHGVCQH